VKLQLAVFRNVKTDRSGKVHVLRAFKDDYVWVCGSRDNAFWEYDDDGHKVYNCEVEAEGDLSAVRVNDVGRVFMHAEEAVVGGETEHYDVEVTCILCQRWLRSVYWTQKEAARKGEPCSPPKS
jgi:hypothetical protein